MPQIEVTQSKETQKDKKEKLTLQKSQNFQQNQPKQKRDNHQYSTPLSPLLLHQRDKKILQSLQALNTKNGDKSF